MVSWNGELEKTLRVHIFATRNPSCLKIRTTKTVIMREGELGCCLVTLGLGENIILDCWSITLWGQDLVYDWVDFCFRYGVILHPNLWIFMTGAKNLVITNGYLSSAYWQTRQNWQTVSGNTDKQQSIRPWLIVDSGVMRRKQASGGMTHVFFHQQKGGVSFQRRWSEAKNRRKERSRWKKSIPIPIPWGVEVWLAPGRPSSSFFVASTSLLFASPFLSTYAYLKAVLPTALQHFISVMRRKCRLFIFRSSSFPRLIW
jgi:hypothetical protein